MAVAAAGGGLLIAAAAAVPASAAAQGAPHGSHKITMTAHRAHAGHGIGPHVILPCVAKAGSGIRPASCGDQTITCVITAEAPFVTTAINEVNAIAQCIICMISIGLAGFISAQIVRLFGSYVAPWQRQR
jgi:hypothetical protein